MLPFFGSCVIHILYTGCAKIKKKIRRQRVKTCQRESETTFYRNFYVLLTVHLSVILDNDQRDAHLLNLLYNIFITFLYMFRALYAHHQEVELY